MKTDITSTEDIKKLVDAFYDSVLKDEALKPFFADLDFDKHLPRMVQFWSFAILEIPGYTTNLFEVHKLMPLQKMHFESWLSLFKQTVNDMFEGSNADKAIQKAIIIGISMESKIVVH